MVNQAASVDIPIGEKGFVSKPRGAFLPGEYRRLSNAEIVGDKIVGRRNMKMPNYNDTGEYIRRSGMRHIGFWQDWSVYTDDLKIIAYSTSGEVSLIADVSGLLPYTYNTSTLGTITYDGFHNIVGFFTYLGYNYILVYSYVHRTGNIASSLGSPATSTGFKLYRYLDRPNGAVPPDTDTNDLYLINSDENYNNEFPLPDVWIPGLEYKVQSASEFDYMNSYFNNYFFFKERLFICAKNGLFFSSPTNPEDFQIVNGGGYFKQAETFNFAVADNDKIYVLSNNSVYVITYADDPNVDAVVTKISDTIGGITGCVFRSNIYFVNNEGLFIVNNNNVEKIMDTDFDDGLNVFPRQTLVSFGEYLVLNKVYEDSVSGKTPTSSSYEIRTNKIAGSTEKTGAYSIGGAVRITPEAVWVDVAGNDPIAIVADSTWGPSNGAAIEQTEAGALTTTLSIRSPSSADPSYSDHLAPLEKGQVYTVSAYFKAVSGFTAGTASILLNFTDDAGVSKTTSSAAVVTGVQIYNVVTPAMVTGSWVRATMTFKVIDPTITKMQITLRATTATAGAKVRYAGIMLEKADTAKPFIGNNLAGYAATFWGPTQFGGTAIYYTTYSNPAFRYWEDVYPYWYLDGADPNGNITGFNTYFINMDNGAVHVLDYEAMYSQSGAAYSNFISHICINSNYSDDVPNGDTLFFLNSDRLGASNPSLPNQYVSYMNYELDTTVFDHLVYVPTVGAKVRRKTDPKYLIEIDSFMPDGTEFLMKKFRNIEIMAKFPSKRFQFSKALDNRVYQASMDLNDDESLLVGGQMRLHLPHRMGFNQRSRSISLKFNTKASAPLDEDYDFLEISAMRLLWTPTQRDPLSSSYSPAST